MTKLPDPQLTATKRPCVSVPMHFVHLPDAVHFVHTRHGGICSAALHSTRPAVHGTREYQTRRHDYEALHYSGLPTSISSSFFFPISSSWFWGQPRGIEPIFVRRKPCKSPAYVWVVTVGRGRWKAHLDACYGSGCQVKWGPLGGWWQMAWADVEDL